MPSPKPSPRRASSAGRAGSPKSGTGRRDVKPSSGKNSTSGGSKASRAMNSEKKFNDRPDRGSTQRSANRSTPKVAGAKGSVRRDFKTTASPRVRRNDDRDFDESVSLNRRPRPSAPRGANTNGSPRRNERPSYRDDRSGSDAPRRDGPSRGRDASSARGRRPSLAPRDQRPGPRTRPTSSRRPPREISPEEREREQIERHAKGKGWGGVARKGAANIKSTGAAMEVTASAGVTPDELPQWVQDVRPAKTTSPTKVKAKVKYALPGDVAADVRKAFIGTAYMREKMVITLTRAAEAYDRKRYEEALRLGRTVADATPGVAPVRELTGLAAYRAERWSMAKIHLRAHFAITGDPEHLALVMDCDRANHRYRAVEKTFHELEASEPTADVLSEGRIVMASALADQHEYAQAIALLTNAGATKQLRNPSFRHVRLWYALADVFDRAGDSVSARELFARVVIAEPEAYDAQGRLDELGSTTPKKNRKRRTTPVSKKKVD